MALQAQIVASVARAKRFLWSDVGHGWSLLRGGPRPDSPVTPLGRSVIAWVKGDYTS